MLISPGRRKHQSMCHRHSSRVPLRGGLGATRVSRSGDRHAHPTRRRTGAVRGLRQRRVNLDVAAQDRPEVVGQGGRPRRLHEWPRATDRLGEVARGLRGGGREDVYLVDVVRSRLPVVRRLEAERHGSGPLLAVSGIRAEVRDPRDADVVRWRARMLRARREPRSHGAAEAAAHQAVEDARMQAAAVLLELVLPFTLHGGALRIEVVEAAEAPAGRADLAGELRQHGGFAHDGGIDPASGDRTAARDAAARQDGLTDAAAVGGGADLVVRAGAVAGGRAVLARGLADAAGGGGRADLARGAGAVAGGRAVLARGLADAAGGGGRADLPRRAGAVARGRAVLARRLADAARGGRRADLARGAGAVAGGRAVLARGLADAAGGGGRADLARGAGAVAGGRAVLARGLADAAGGGGRADLARGAGAVAGGRAVLARGLADRAGGGGRADLARGAGAVAGGRAVLARGLADAVPADHHAGLAARAGAVAGRERLLAGPRRNADITREGERDGLQRTLVDAARPRQIGQRVRVAGEHRQVRADAGLGRAARRAHRRPTLDVRHAEHARRRAAVGMERYVDRIARLPEDDDARPARGGRAVVLRHAELGRGQRAVRAHLADAAAEAVEAGSVRTIGARRTGKPRLDATHAGRAGRARAAGAVVVHDAHAAGDARGGAEAAEPEAGQQVGGGDDRRATRDLVGDGVEADAVHGVHAGHRDRTGHGVAQVGDGNGHAGRALPAGALVRGGTPQPAVGAAHADGRGADAVRDARRAVAVAVARARLRAVRPAPGVWPAETDGSRRAAGRALTGDAGIDAGATRRGALQARPPGRVHAALLDLRAVLGPGHRGWSCDEHQKGQAETSTRAPHGSRSASHGPALLALR